MTLMQMDEVKEEEDYSRGNISPMEDIDSISHNTNSNQKDNDVEMKCQSLEFVMDTEKKIENDSMNKKKGIKRKNSKKRKAKDSKEKTSKLKEDSVSKSNSKLNSKSKSKSLTKGNKSNLNEENSLKKSSISKKDKSKSKKDSKFTVKSNDESIKIEVKIDTPMEDLNPDNTEKKSRKRKRENDNESKQKKRKIKKIKDAGSTENDTSSKDQSKDKKESKKNSKATNHSSQKEDSIKNEENIETKKKKNNKKKSVNNLNDSEYKRRAPKFNASLANRLKDRPRRSNKINNLELFPEEKPLVCEWINWTLNRQNEIKLESQNPNSQNDSNNDTILPNRYLNEYLLLKLFKESKSIVFFTGSGISKNSGLSTYRDEDGIYEKIKRKEQDSKQLFFDEKRVYLPTKTHMAISRLIQLNRAKFVITQNCDNLHEKSGVPWENIIELHGNMYLQKCRSCNSIFEMDEVQQQPIFVHHKDISIQIHRDRILHGLICHNCGQMDTLEHTITNFGEPIEQDRWDIAHEQAEKADLIVVIGSSCAVSPANTLPTKAKNLIICNLSSTPLDYEADFICKSTTSDQFMEYLLFSIGEKIPSYEFNVNIHFELCLDSDNNSNDSKNNINHNNKENLNQEYDLNKKIKEPIIDQISEKSKYNFTVTNLDDISRTIESIELSYKDRSYILSQENDFDIEVEVDQDSTVVFKEFIIHFKDIPQLQESSRRLCMEGESFKIGESLELTLSCFIHEADSQFRIIEKIKNSHYSES